MLRRAHFHVVETKIKTTDGKQEPFLYGSLGGADVSLMQRVATEREPRPAVTPIADGGTTVAADPRAEARRDYELTLQLGTRQAWESYLAHYPEGLFASLARGQLEKIVASEAQVTAKQAKEAITQA
jgi:hypothetical protein